MAGQRIFNLGFNHVPFLDSLCDPQKVEGRLDEVVSLILSAAQAKRRIICSGSRWLSIGSPQKRRNASCPS